MSLSPILRRIALASLLAFAGGIAAQEAGPEWNPRSGDPWVDAWLGDMNRYGQRHRQPFIDEVVRYHGAPRALVVELLDRRWPPGDIYMACGIAQLSGRSCTTVAEAWQADPAPGWGAVASRYGIEPGSPGFHRLKNGIVPTYERWARPIELDAELSRLHPAHPGAGKGPTADAKPRRDKSGKRQPGKDKAGKHKPRTDGTGGHRPGEH